MNGKLSIRPLEDEMRIYVMPYSSLYDYEVDIYSSLDKSFDDIISDLDRFDDDVEYCISMYDDNEEYLEVLEKIKNDGVNCLKNISDIEFFYEPDVVSKFVNDNPILLTKRIIFSDYNLLDNSLIEKIESNFKDTSNIYFKIKGNYSLITFDEYKNTACSINKKVAEVERFDFSPLEKIMYVYDMVRDKVYSEVDEDEDKAHSRNLSSALLGDKIVCLGYSIIFQTLLNKLDIDCYKITLKDINSNDGHARVAVHVKDEKYDIDGVYFFDPTWDCKRSENDNKFLLSYKYFAMTKEKIDEYDEGKIIDRRFPYFSSDMALEFDELVDRIGLERLPSDFILSINSMSCLVGGEDILDEAWNDPRYIEIVNQNKDETSKKIHELIKYFDTPINADVLLEVLYNVRKQQYYSNPEKYPFDLHNFYKTIFMSNWEFDDNELNNFMIFCTNEDTMENKFKRIIKCAQESELDKRIVQVKLTKTLRSIYNKNRVEKTFR